MDIRTLLISKPRKRKNTQDLHVDDENNENDENNEDEFDSSIARNFATNSTTETSVVNIDPSTSSSFSDKCTTPNFLDVTKLSRDEPIQPRLSSYPKTKCGNQCRDFSASWYTMYKWVEYIEEYDVTLLCLSHICTRGQ